MLIQFQVISSSFIFLLDKTSWICEDIHRKYDFLVVIILVYIFSLVY